MRTEKKQLATLEDYIMNQLFDERVMNAIIETTHINIMHDSSNNSTVALIERSINTSDKTNCATVFDKKDRDTLENIIMDEVPNIAIWLKNSKEKDFTITATQNENIGHGISYKNGILKEYNTKDITIVLTRDENNKAGFRCKTTYPNIRKPSAEKTPTGRNLIPDLIQTRTFQRSTPKERASFVAAAVKGLNRPLSFMEQLYTDIVSSPHFDNDMKIELSKNQIDVYHMNGRYSILHIMPDKTQFEHKPTPELKELSKFANDKINKHLGRSSTPKMTRKQRLAIAGITEDDTTDMSYDNPYQDTPQF